MDLQELSTSKFLGEQSVRDNLADFIRLPSDVQENIVKTLQSDGCCDWTYNHRDRTIFVDSLFDMESGFIEQFVCIQFAIFSGVAESLVVETGFDTTFRHNGEHLKSGRLDYLEQSEYKRYFVDYLPVGFPVTYRFTDGSSDDDAIETVH